MPAARTARCLSWGDDDAVTFATLDSSTGVSRVSANGGEVEVLTRPDPAQNEADHTATSVISHGRGVLFTIVRTNGTSDVAALDLRTRRYKTLLRGNMPQYVAVVDESARRRQTGP